MNPDPTTMPTDKPAPSAARPRWTWLPAVILLAAGYLVYSNTFHNTLILDDLNSIIRNPGIRRLWPLSAALNPPKGPISFWTRPIVNVTLAWDYAHSGENLAGYRRTNRTLHLLSGWMLYLLLSRAFKRTGPADRPAWLGDFFRDGAQLAAFVAALVWMVHPLNTAAVNYLSQRAELLVALFLFVMLHGLRRAADSEPRQAWRWQAAAVGSCWLGMGSKETMLVAPLLALLFDRIFIAVSWRDILRKRWWVHGALWLTALWPISRHLAYSPHITPELLSPGMRWHYLLTQCWGLTRMIRLAFWPQPLVFFYGMGLVTDPLKVWPQGLFLLILAGATLWALVRHPRAGFAGAFFFGVLAPSSSFVPILGQPIAEHRMYTPLAALVALVAGGAFLAAVRTKKKEDIALFLSVGILLAAGFGIAAHRRNADYCNPLVLWQDTVRKIPGSPEPHNDYANALREAGRFPEAVEEYRQALRLKPDYMSAHNNLGTLLAELGRFEEAERHLQEALRLKPDSPQLEVNLGMVCADLGRYEDALRHLESANEAMPGNPQVIAQRVHVLAELGRGHEALERIRSALALLPGDPELNNALGVLLCRLGRPSEAIEPLRRAMDASPARTRVRFNLGRALFESGRLEEAETEFRGLGTPDARKYLEKIERLRAGSAP
jgi:Flp pilus assembly protein TadD